jgi:putative ABC transport system permease protein
MPDQYAYSTYSNIFIKSDKKPASKDLVDRSLDEIAKETASLIVKRIPEPKKGGHQFVYQKYGRGELPKYMKEASKETQKVSSALLQYRRLCLER